MRSIILTGNLTSAFFGVDWPKPLHKLTNKHLKITTAVEWLIFVGYNFCSILLLLVKSVC
ncbi:MAG: hypothetical protein EAY81_07905 [Bacteroidetes bacterium]|nr:MAG: hypothetical protein EAY81_07905 [Bacteroidota bacterium]